jgi:uncharacterized membrane-anchored protein
MNKLPAITLSFWIMKICATTLRETAGDLLSMTLKVGYGVSSAILLSFFFATLVVQLSVKIFHPAPGLNHRLFSTLKDRVNQYAVYDPTFPI